MTLKNLFFILFNLQNLEVKNNLIKERHSLEKIACIARQI
jgi:hypothetical protein